VKLELLFIISLSLTFDYRPHLMIICNMPSESVVGCYETVVYNYLCSLKKGVFFFYPIHNFLSDNTDEELQRDGLGDGS
jgi:hypothetical protein